MADEGWTSAAYPLGEAFQRKILSHAIQSDFGRLAPEILRPDFFGDPSSQSPRYILARLLCDFVTKHRESPGVESMDELVRHVAKTQRPEARRALETEWRLVRETRVSDPTYVESRATDWARGTALLGVMVDAGRAIRQALDDGVSLDVDRILRVVTNAASMGSAQAHGGSWLEGDLSYWSEANDTRRRIPTRLAPLDAVMGGGALPGECYMIMAPPKYGKTTALGNIAVGASRSQKGVALFSFEMRERAMRRRLDRTLARATKDELHTDLGRLLRAREGMRLTGAGSVWLEECFPSSMTMSVAQRRVEWLRSNGTPVDLVIFDYLNIMVPGADRDNALRHTLSRLAREMCDFAKTMNVAVWSACLCNRAAAESPTFKRGDIAEAYEVLAVVDGAIGMCADPLMYAQRMRNFYAVCLREEEDDVLAGRYYLDAARMLLVPLAVRSEESQSSSTTGDKQEGETDEQDITQLWQKLLAGKA